MKIPRNISGAHLANALRKFGYAKQRQDGSHIRLTTQTHGEHHVTIPNHNPVKLGTLTAILKAVARHHQITVIDVLHRLEL